MARVDLIDPATGVKVSVSEGSPLVALWARAPRPVVAPDAPLTRSAGRPKKK